MGKLRTREIHETTMMKSQHRYDALSCLLVYSVPKLNGANKILFGGKRVVTELKWLGFFAWVCFWQRLMHFCRSNTWKKIQYSIVIEDIVTESQKSRRISLLSQSRHSFACLQTEIDLTFREKCLTSSLYEPFATMLFSNTMLWIKASLYE